MDIRSPVAQLLLASSTIPPVDETLKWIHGTTSHRKEEDAHNSSTVSALFSPTEMKRDRDASCGIDDLRLDHDSRDFERSERARENRGGVEVAIWSCSTTEMKFSKVRMEVLPLSIDAHEESELDVEEGVGLGAGDGDLEDVAGGGDCVEEMAFGRLGARKSSARSGAIDEPARGLGTRFVHDHPGFAEATTMEENLIAAAQGRQVRISPMLWVLERVDGHERRRTHLFGKRHPSPTLRVPVAIRRDRVFRGWVCGSKELLLKGTRREHIYSMERNPSGFYTTKYLYAGWRKRCKGFAKDAPRTQSSRTITGNERENGSAHGKGTQSGLAHGKGFPESNPRDVYMAYKPPLTWYTCPRLCPIAAPTLYPSEMQISSRILAFALSFASLVAGQPLAEHEQQWYPNFGRRSRPKHLGSSHRVQCHHVPCLRLRGHQLRRPLQHHRRGLRRRQYRRSSHRSPECALFLRYWVIAVEGANNADLNTRCEALESEVRAMREQLDGMEARRIAGSGGYGAGAVLYTHEKDMEAFKAGADLKDAKERPPTYAD
ncbi:hypothetical protein B0H19DRAFT_1233118 [Mycena capillaripes]|nr:hypothetical protein B0H19DRAFT_1233118 [Mycena capillaripes]